MDQSYLSAPQIVFIVPYRDRERQMRFFRRHMGYIMEDVEPGSYAILFVHQKDNRPFNRGAMKNIGAIQAKQKWPEAYPTITLVFNDVDTMPLEKGLIEYNTTSGVVKHFYGFTHTLGGIVSICGADFDKCGGFPNLWAWGFEDNVFQRRCMDAGLRIQRGNIFYPIMDRNIIHLQDGRFREVNQREYNISLSEQTADTLRDVKNIQTQASEDPEFIHVTFFKSKYDPPVANTFTTHDLRKGKHVFSNSKPPPTKKKALMFV